MRISSELPPKSRIRIQQATDGESLTWKSSAARFSGCFGAGFITVWLCGWFLGEKFALERLWSQYEKGEDLELTLMAWLAIWTCGGYAVMKLLLKLLRMNRENLVLGVDELRYLAAESGAEEVLVLRRVDISSVTLDRESVNEPYLVSVASGGVSHVIGGWLEESDKRFLYGRICEWLTLRYPPFLEEVGGI